MKRPTCLRLAAITGALAVVSCSSAAPGPEPIAKTTAALGVDPIVDYFDKATLLMTVQFGEETVVLQYTEKTTSLPAGVIPEPPDPCFGQETAWNNQIERDPGLSQAVIERLVHFGRFRCAAQITIGADGTITSFQPGLAGAP